MTAGRDPRPRGHAKGPPSSQDRQQLPIPDVDDLTGPCVLAYATETDHQPEVRRAAAAHAREHGCVLILYAADAASWFSEPTPGAWSADGERDLYGERLRIHDLTTLGRHDIARQVADVHGGSVRAGAWLPKDHGPGALAAYAVGQEAHLVFVPATLETIDEISAHVAGSTDALSELRQPGISLRVIERDGEAESVVGEPRS
jgi:hypothetical protein